MPRSPGGGLRLQLLLIVLIALTPLLALTFYNASQNREAEIRGLERRALQFAEIISFQEREMMSRGRAVLLSLSEAVEVRGVSLGGGTGPDPDAVRRCDEYFARQLRLHPEYLNLGLADTTGRIWCSAIPLPGVVDISDREYFHQAVQSRGFGVGVFQVGRITGRPSINLGQAIVDAQGRVTGVIYLASDLRVTDQITDEVRLLLPEVVTVSKLDRNGVFLARHPESTPGVGRVAAEFPLIQSGLARNRGIARSVDSTGTAMLYAYSRVASGVRQGDAFVLLSFPENEAFRSINREMHNYLLTIAAVAVLAVVLSYLSIGALVLRPARSLLNATQRLSAGDLRARAGPPYGRGDVGKVAVAFDRMAEALQEQQAERDRAEAALRRSEEAYRSLVEEAPYGIICSTPDGRILTANPALVRMLGYDSEEELKSVDASVLYADPSVRQRLLETFQHTGRDLDVSGIEFLRKDGKKILVRLAGRPVLDAEGRLLQIEGIVEDETDRHRLEQQLQQAQKMEAVGRLAGGIAHDFNNLLGVILGHGDILLRNLPPGHPDAEALRTITEAAAHGAALTRQILGFARREETHPAVIDVNAPIARARGILDRLVGENFTLEIAPGKDLPNVLVDPSQVEQIVLNLVVNARDSMPEGGAIALATEEVRFEQPRPVVDGVMPAGGYVCLTVRDRGVGIAPEVLPHIFEPFFTTKASPRDTGLGLAIVHNIVTQAGGYVSVESDVGRGTTMRVFLPPTSAAPAQPAPGPSERDTRGTETILLVEDEESLQRLLKTVLERVGYRVFASKSAHDALTLVDRGICRCDLLVTDVIMPRIGGRELADRLRARQRGLKVLFISGYPSDAFGAGETPPAGSAFLTKPFTADELLQKVREVLDREPGEA